MGQTNYLENYFWLQAHRGEVECFEFLYWVAFLATLHANFENVLAGTCVLAWFTSRLAMQQWCDFMKMAHKVIVATFM